MVKINEHTPSLIKKRLLRNVDNKMISGVASGIAEYVGLDPLIIRLGFVALTVFNGIGIPIYVVLWVLMPKSTTAPI